MAANILKGKYFKWAYVSHSVTNVLRTVSIKLSIIAPKHQFHSKTRQCCIRPEKEQ